MSTSVVGWQDEHLLDHRRRLRNATLVSLAVHGLVLAAFAVSSPAPAPPMGEVLSVDLVAGPPLAAPPAPAAAAAAPAAAKAPSPPPDAAPAPSDPPPAPAPMPKAPVQVLPEETPGRIRKAEPAPETLAKAKPTPKPPPTPAKPKPQPRKPEKELSYEDAMAALDDEIGVDETAALLQPAPPERSEAEPALSTGQPGSREGVTMTPELAAWQQATKRRIQNKWVTPPNFRGQGLATSLELRLSASGDVLGEPKVVRTSGDPYFDDNAVRGVLSAAPLPPPPRAGTIVFIFRSEAN